MTGLHAGAEPPPPPRCYAIAGTSSISPARRDTLGSVGGRNKDNAVPFGPFGGPLATSPREGRESSGDAKADTRRRRRRQNTHGERRGGGRGGGEKREGAGRQATQKAPCSDLWTPRTTARFRCASHCSMGLSLCITYCHAPALVIARHGHLGPDLQFAVRFRVYFLKWAVLKVRSKNERGA